MPEAKPYVIPKQLVWEAYRRVKANRGAAGVDGESLAAFEKDLKGNLYKVWNRMSSGSYFPPPVRLVEIKKDDGGKRPLGIPTVADRVAQTVVKMVLEPAVEPKFHPDSYGYRPGKSALDAVGVARKRCWEFDWVIDLDIKAECSDSSVASRDRRRSAGTDWPVTDSRPRLAACLSSATPGFRRAAARGLAATAQCTAGPRGCRCGAPRHVRPAHDPDCQRSSSVTRTMLSLLTDA